VVPEDGSRYADIVLSIPYRAFAASTGRTNLRAHVQLWLDPGTNPTVLATSQDVPFTLTR
jgi:hypothetical protein